MHVTPQNQASIINMEPRNHPVEKENQHINLPGCIKSPTKNSEKFHSVKSCVSSDFRCLSWFCDQLCGLSAERRRASRVPWSLQARVL